MGLPKAYEPGKYEADIYSRWEKGRAFIANPHSPKPHFSMAMPPPNETAQLHLGSALFVTLQDVIARHERQKGRDVLWLPGTDHAAIATNALIEKKLAEQGTDKHAVGREEFIKQVKSFAGNNRDAIISQLRAMGASCDWTRLRYTLDDTLNRCVNEVFVKMYNDGLIYRGNRIVNWDPNLETTVSDDEVEHKEEKGRFYTLRYGPFQIGTARPETKFGDKYVVMHPDDERYKQYNQGDTFEAEWINGPVTATVIKDEAVDPKFGTGVMTITPWHDHTDFEIAERHGLEKEQIIDFDGKLLPIAEEFQGMGIEQARPKIVEKLKDKGLLVKVDDNYTHNLALNSRGKGVIEPQIKLQWFIDVNRPAVQWKGQLRSLKEVMRAVIEDSDIKITPKRFEKTYYHWIDNLYDWCISRQIWWGHQVPVWYKGNEVYVGVQPPEGARPVESSAESGMLAESEHSTGQGWARDPDTLDTWFSSSLWTWSTLINPELAGDFNLSLEDLLQRSPDFKAYHPTSVLETGWDILFFWVARMILSTTYVTGQVPFKQVYLHGLVRTEAGKKMSKSDPDSIIDPLEIIPQYGTDALRLALVSGVHAGQDQRLGISKIVDNRNFCNKLWNVARFIENLGGDKTAEPEPQTPADHWILNKLSILTGAIDKDLTNFRFSEAYQRLYHFVWDDLADWYIEASKGQANAAVLNRVLEDTLVLLHPFAPFITEAVWQNLGHEELLAAQPLPKAVAADKAEAAKFEELIELVSFMRQIKSIAKIRESRIFAKNTDILRPEIMRIVEKLTNIKTREQDEESRSPGVKFYTDHYSIWLDINEDELKKAAAKLESRAVKHKEAIKRYDARLNNKSYMDNAPEDLIKETRAQREAEIVLLGDVEAEIKALKA
jgi:valyl-tRNA synthetase